MGTKGTIGLTIFLAMIGLMLVPAFPWGMNFFQFAQLMIEARTLSRLRERADRSPRELDKIIGELLSSIERTNASRGSAARFRDFLMNRVVPEEIADRHAPTLVRILKENRNAIESAGNQSIVELLTRFSRSDASKGYLLSLFAEPSGRLRDEAIWSLSWSQTWIGDREMFDALAAIYQREGDVRRATLPAMQKISNDWSAPHIRKALLATKSKDEFEGLASIVNRTGSNELFEVVLSRIPEFGKPAWARPEQFTAYEKWKAQGRPRR